MTYNKFTTYGKRTSRATRQLLKAVIGDLAPTARKALLDEAMNYIVGYAFGYPDTSAIGTGIPRGMWPTRVGRWITTGSRDSRYFERENFPNWKPIRLTSQGYIYLQTIRIDDYATVGYSAGSYVKIGIDRVTKEQAELGNEVYVRPCNFYTHFTQSNRIHGCWSWSGEDFQIWVRPMGHTSEVSA